MKFPYKQTNSVVLVRKRTIPTERPPLVGEVSANILEYSLFLSTLPTAQVTWCRMIGKADSAVRANLTTRPVIEP
jgi:hypothetical protein